MVASPLVVDEAFFATFSQEADVVPVTGVKPSDAAYVIFTSGTTGEPKGSILEHQSIQAYSRDMGTFLDVDTKSRVLQFAAFVFDLSIEEIVGTLTRGGCICIPSNEERLGDLAFAMENLRVNWANLTPTVIRTLTPADVPHLKTLVSAGEILGDDLVKTWTNAPAIDLFNTYGPSECTVAATISKKLRRSDNGTNIGEGRSCRIWIVNPSNHHLLSPMGAVGVIMVEGLQVGRGYLKRPEQTAAAFITDPVWAKCSIAKRECTSLEI
jgi:non-ribosomal peptide synthetase component F